MRREPDAYDKHMVTLARDRTPVHVNGRNGIEPATLIGWAATGHRSAVVVFADGNTRTVRQAAIILREAAA